MVRAQRTLNTMCIQIGEMFGIGKLMALSQDAAQEVGRAERVGVLGLQNARTVGDIFPQDGLGFIPFAEMPKDGPQAFGRIEGNGVVATELDTAVVQILPQERLSLGSPVRLVEERPQQIIGPQACRDIWGRKVECQVGPRRGGDSRPVRTGRARDTHRRSFRGSWPQYRDGRRASLRDLMPRGRAAHARSGS